MTFKFGPFPITSMNQD